MSRRSRMAAAASAGLAIALMYALLPWVGLWWRAYVSRPMERRAALALLSVTLMIHAALLVAAPIVAAWGLVRYRSAGRDAGKRIKAVRLVALGLVTAIGLVAIEAASAAWWALAHRLPALPTTFEDDGRADRPRRVLVVGESSALGEPYQDWLSIGRILAWQLGAIAPVELDVQARGGASLEVVFPSLLLVKNRPDVVLVYAGHNEFQAHFSWDRTVPYYRDEDREDRSESALRLASRISPLARMVREAIDTQRLDAPPPAKASRKAVDVPCCTREEADVRLFQYRRRLEAIADWCRTIGATAIFVVPAGNDGGFEPNRSVLPPGATRSERAAFTLALATVRDTERPNPPAAAAAYRSLIARYPGFAECHFRLARLLEKAGAIDEARRHDVLSRDLDAMPQRCRSTFQETVRQVARSHGAIVVDGPSVLAAESPRGLLDDHLFHDAHHPTFGGYVVLARDALRQLRDRRIFGWPEAIPAPDLDPIAVARHFRFGPPEWAEVCRRSSSWYEKDAYIRFDPADRLARSKLLQQAADRILAGTAPEDAGVPGVGIGPPGRGPVGRVLPSPR